MVLALAVYASAFSVNQSERAIKLRLGEIVEADYAPGLHFSWPLIETVKKFSRKVMTLDAKPERFLTAEKKNVIVDSYVKWRVLEPARYYLTVGGSSEQANLRLEQIVKDIMRAEFSKRDIKTLIAEERETMRDILVQNSARLASNWGIEIIDIRIKKIDLPDEVSSSVYRRMEAERARVAREFRSQGAEAAERIKADADKQRTVMLAEAQREAERLRGEGDAKAAEIYASGYGKDPEFFALYRSLQAYKQTFQDKRDVILAHPQSEFFRYFGRQ